ncbi:hypothetical protein HDA43_005264 [Streptosporangium sandarakinum]|uniref:Uncharacterized protein n=1 Tax=Streptosporangium sandarakinum TaxID=1260955 RepID=A0A852V701_9ACTN|nr:hypothetical protein [Streptosporangium sandarakinum]
MEGHHERAVVTEGVRTPLAALHLLRHLLGCCVGERRSGRLGEDGPGECTARQDAFHKGSHDVFSTLPALAKNPVRALLNHGGESGNSVPRNRLTHLTRRARFFTHHPRKTSNKSRFP